MATSKCSGVLYLLALSTRSEILGMRYEYAGQPRKTSSLVISPRYEYHPLPGVNAPLSNLPCHEVRAFGSAPCSMRNLQTSGRAYNAAY